MKISQQQWTTALNLHNQKSRNLCIKKLRKHDWSVDAPNKSPPGSIAPRTDGDAITTESPSTECTQHQLLVPEAPTATSGSSHSMAATETPLSVKIQQSAPVNLHSETDDNAQEERSERDVRDEDTRLQYEVYAILEHRMRNDGSGAVELLIHWADETEGSSTWELEEEIQLDAQDILYAYWSSYGGRSYALFRNPENPPPELYFVYKVLQHEKKRGQGFRFEIQWVGHPPTRGETSWEPESQLRKTAPTLLQDYWESVGGRAKHLEKRRRAKKVRTE
ncbi:hypothetical protein GGR57DRAFT_364045 [Xylariaceae sp. FL1272]|nr:hypothetical protein GGR57DRAFT_364045 [Xylariaceae sp. FL1272]